MDSSQPVSSASRIQDRIDELLDEGLTPNQVLARLEVEDQGRNQFLCDVRAVVAYHWSGLPECRPDESVWARLDAVLFDDEGQERTEPDYEAVP